MSDYNYGHQPDDPLVPDLSAWSKWGGPEDGDGWQVLFGGYCCTLVEDYEGWSWWFCKPGFDAAFNVGFRTAEEALAGLREFHAEEVARACG